MRSASRGAGQSTPSYAELEQRRRSFKMGGHGGNGNSTLNLSGYMGAGGGPSDK
jgi:hypothetical protein